MNSLATFLNQNAPDLKTELLPLFKEHFDLSEEEIINNLLTINREKGADARKLNLLGYINSQSQEIPSVFFENLPSQELHSSLLGLNCSLKVENIHLLNIRMKKFIARFFREHDIPISVNMYITPSQETPCFKPHADFTEVFIYQLMGPKKWTFFCDQEGQYLAGENDQASLEGDKLKQSHKKDIVLNVQDVLHIPPLIYHEACAVSGPSIHLTISLNRLRAEHVLRVFESALTEVMNVPKQKNLSNLDFDVLWEKTFEKTSQNDFRNMLQEKKEQIMFLAKSQILVNGR